MAKHTDHLAGSFGTDNTGGFLTGLLAEEDVFDRRTLLRLGSWGTATVGALIIAVYASQTSIASRRDQVAAADLARQAQQIQSVARESQNEARRLASAIDTLNADRDRLYSRVTVLEQGLDSVTGAIARQSAAVASPPGPAPASAAPAGAAAELSASVAPSSPPAPAPQLSAVATTVAKTADKPPAEAKSAEPAPATVSSVAPKASSVVPKASEPPVTPPALMAARSMMGPPDAAATKLIEPEKPAEKVAEKPAEKVAEKPESVAEKPEKPAKGFTAAPMPDIVASAPPAVDAEPDTAKMTTPKVAVKRTEFGVDVGGANSVGGLRALWRGLLKSRSNAALAALQPIIVIRESTNGLGMQLRLVAGPLTDAAAAAKICAGLIESERPCETTVFDGQRLAMNADEPVTTAPKPPPAAVKPTPHRRSYSRHVSVEEPVKKPDPPSTLSSFFSRR
jgi:hypothetical protein